MPDSENAFTKNKMVREKAERGQWGPVSGQLSGKASVLE